MDEDATWYRSRPWLRPHRDGDPASPQRGHSSPPLFGPCLLWPWSPISVTAEPLLAFSVLHRHCFPKPLQVDANSLLAVQGHIQDLLVGVHSWVGVRNMWLPIGESGTCPARKFKKNSLSWSKKEREKHKRGLLGRFVPSSWIRRYSLMRICDSDKQLFGVADVNNVYDSFIDFIDCHCQQIYEN